MSFTPPANLGSFNFPPPYSRTGIRLTNKGNAQHGCEPRLYSYHSVVNNHRGSEHMYVVAGRISDRPALLRVHKGTGTVETMDRQLPEGTAEGWYFSDTLPHTLYMIEGSRLLRLDVVTGQVDVAFALDPAHGDDIWQAHSSSDNSTHAATVRRRSNTGAYPKLGCVVSRHGRQRFFGVGDHDECHISKNGRWLVIEKDDNNYITDLDRDEIRVITNDEGALAHLDMGDDVMVGEDDQHEPSACVRWSLSNPSLPRKLLYATQWGPGMGHVALRGDAVLLSSNLTNEVLLVSLNGGLVRHIAPGMISGNGYDYQLRACLDPTGEYACWIAHVAGRFDLFMAPIGSTAPVVVQPPPPIVVNPQPGGPMKQLAIFTIPEDAHVELQHDNGNTFVSQPGMADGRPAHIIAIDEGTPDGHGAWLIMAWDKGREFRYHGVLWLNRGERAEFAVDVFEKPKPF